LLAILTLHPRDEVATKERAGNMSQAKPSCEEQELRLDDLCCSRMRNLSGGRGKRKRPVIFYHKNSKANPLALYGGWWEDATGCPLSFSRHLARAHGK